MSMELFFMLTLNVNILSVIGDLEKPCYWENLDKGYKESLYYLLKLHVNLQLSPNKDISLKKKKSPGATL